MERENCRTNALGLSTSKRKSMIVVIQRVTSASVEINQVKKADIGKGLLVLVGIETADSAEEIEWLASKIVNLRIFNDPEGVMNVSVKDDNGDIIVVSQFTLHAATKKAANSNSGHGNARRS